MLHYTVAEFHGAVTHFPVAMLIAAMLFEIGAAVFKKAEWRIVSFWLLVTGVVGAVPSLISGWITGNEFFGHTQNPPDVFLRHRLFAFITSGLALLLLIWRGAAKDNLKGGALGGSIALAVLVMMGVSYTGYLGGLMSIGGSDSSNSSTARTNASANSTGTTSGKVDPQLVAKGKLVYASNNCASCHRIAGQGGADGPDLTHEGSRNGDAGWQVAHLQNPSKTHPGSFMPAYNQLSQADLNALANYLVSLK